MEALRSLIRSGYRIALADGCGSPCSVGAELSRIAEEVGGVRLLLGWCPVLPAGLDLEAFADVRTIMGGYALRNAIDEGVVHYVPARLGAVPALVQGPLRPDVVIVAATRGPGGLHLGSEVGWTRAAIETGARVAVVLDAKLPVCDAEGPLPPKRLTIVGEDDRGPTALPVAELDSVHTAIGARIAGLVPAGARVQVGPGAIGRATMEALWRPVSVDSGLLTDAVVDLDSRGLLQGEPSATYLAGTHRLYEWADGRPVLHRVEVTHDITRLCADPPLMAVNTALQMDLTGQVNVERASGRVVGGVGGHADFAAAASRSAHGLSILALASSRNGRSSLVAQLDVPVSTPRSDVDVVVTEQGMADLRGLDDTERTRALLELWDHELGDAPASDPR